MKFCFILFFIFCLQISRAQDSPFAGYLPIQEEPKLHWISPAEESEPIIFNAKPVVYYQLYNSYEEMLDSNLLSASSLYLNFSSQFRMYEDESTPLRTPSYRIFLGWQNSFSLNSKSLFTYLIETGHYSNGQSGCAWDQLAKDQSFPCTKKFRTINSESRLNEMLNRNNGNFSSNLSKVAIQLEQKSKGSNQFYHSYQLAYTRFHPEFLGVINYGGSGEQDIEIIGDGQFEFQSTLHKEFENQSAVFFRQSVYYFQNSHPSINPLRYEARISFFPSDWYTSFSVFYVHGHDNYNYRLVDSSNQIGLGLLWDINRLWRY